MNYLLVVAAAIICCVFLNQIFSKFAVPMLLIFIILGMVFGVNGIHPVNFDNYDLSEKLCSVGLIFIMFFGGFCTSWKEARPAAAQAIVLSSAGVLLTSCFTTMFCYFVLKMKFAQSFLLGAVTSSTDAASVFSILRSKKLGLKDHTASLLEVESGSNDPFSYMLTVLAIGLMKGTLSIGSSIIMMVLQISVGLFIGFAVAFGTKFILKKMNVLSSKYYLSLIFGVALLSYTLSGLLKGNGYLSVYITGIVLGNTKMRDKRSVIIFFDGVTNLMQMLIFFLLGLLSDVSKIPSILKIAIPVVLFLTFVSRPLAVMSLLTPFRCSFGKQMLVSWAGLRGASSIVFAIMSINSLNESGMDLFHVVFCLVLISIVFQGTFLSPAARLFKMDDAESNILKTFSDYADGTDLQFISIEISENHPWNNLRVMDMNLPPDTLIVMIKRQDQKLVPHGMTQLKVGDVAIIGAKSFMDDKSISLSEITVEKDDMYDGKKIMDLSLEKNELIVTVMREGHNIIPKGNTVLKKGDVLVING